LVKVLFVAKLGDPTAQLRERGLRVTAVRVAVLEAVRRRPHEGVDKIMAAAATRLGSVSKQAVYDALEALVGALLVRRIEPAGRPALYEARAGDNHHHIVCRSCGAIDDVDCSVGDAPCLEPAQTHGFVIDEAEVTYWGLCPDCQARQI
jgi:Fur family transcriptional regulator, stress-responsive regulator